MPGTRKKHPQVPRYVSPSQLKLEGFESPFDQQLSLTNRWVVLSRLIPWDEICNLYLKFVPKEPTGRPGLNPRIVIGSLIIKHLCNLDDRETVDQISENIYMQYFLGYPSFTNEKPFDASLFVDFRKRLGMENLNAINERIVSIKANLESTVKKVPASSTLEQDHKLEDKLEDNQYQDTNAKPTHHGRVIYDATACPQDIAYPTDLNLLNDSREKLEELIDHLYRQDLHEEKPRTYREVARKTYLQTAQKKNKSRKVIRKANRSQLNYVRRDIATVNSLLNSNYYQMQHFITESVWSDRELIDQVAKEVNSLLPKGKLTGLIIDESGWVKKGNKSVGVGHQYCGNVGKLSNSQVAVFAALNNGDFSSMVDARLFLPEDWCLDSKRCDEAGIPESERRFKTKLELAYEIVEHQSRQIDFDFVSADGYYGNDADFARKIDQLGYLYMLDIHANQSIYIEPVELEIPQRKSAKGPTPKKLRATKPSISVSDYMSKLTEEQWQKLTVRNTTKGKLTGDYHFAKVYIWNKAIDRIEQRLLVIRKTITTDNEIEIKFSFTNANLEQYTPEVIAYMQAQRFFVEHCIKESKQILGIDQFQTRKWSAWLHQTALNFMVSSFILKEKLRNNEDIPLLSARDIKELIIFQLFRQMTEDQMCEKIINRHIRRQQDINNAYLRQNPNLSK